MEQLLVIGAGFMGSGIAQVCAQAGYRVILTDSRPPALKQALSQIGWSVDKLCRKGLITEAPDTVLERIVIEKDLASAATSQWVIEAVLEIEDLKKEIFAEIDHLAPQATPLATNTSSIPITRLAEATRHPERVVGLHFFGPVPFMNLVEVVRGQRTSAEIFDRSVDFVRSIGKSPVRVNRDIPGFVMNRIFSAAFREAVDLVAEGVATPEDIDLGMKRGYGWKAGPFEIADNAGLDTIALIGKSMADLGQEHLFPRSDLIRQLLEQGRLGRKVGKGFYRYTADGKRLSWDRRNKQE